MMQRRTESQEQTRLAFGVADGSARDRRVQLARAIRDLRLGADAKLLGLLVFDQTAEGMGAAWVASDDIVLGHALGPECGKTKLYELRRALTEAGILSVATDRAEDTLCRHYQVDWSGVYSVRGLPLPDGLRGGDFFAPRTIRTANDSPGENSHCGIPPCENPGGETRSISAHAGGGAPAPARLSSCLVFLSSVDVDDKDKRQEILATARRIHKAINAHRLDRRLDTETRRFLLEISVIALYPGGWSEWVEYAVAATGRARANSPGAYLRNTLRTSLVEFAGFCENEAEAAATMGRALAAARPIAKRLLACPMPEAEATA